MTEVSPTAASTRPERGPLPGPVHPPAASESTETPRVDVAEGNENAGAEMSARIGGLSVLKGLILYGATLTFAGFYAYFAMRIVSAPAGAPPEFNDAMVAAAAGLAGVLGSAFALVIGVRRTAVNAELGKAIAAEESKDGLSIKTRARRLLSLEPGDATGVSWPQTFGIWIYAAIASLIAIVYFLYQSETPEAIKTVAVVFAGYVIAFVTTAYGLGSDES